MGLANTTTKYNGLVWFLMSCGLFLRAWKFGSIPMGLNQDEAAIGYDAFCLFHYGVDRNGVSFPVQSINFGSGGHILYGYLIAPLTYFGLNPFIIRLPMLITSFVALILVYSIVQKLWGGRVAVWVLFFLVFSPWHILLSRWGLEGNLFPSLFILGLFGLVRSLNKPLWFIFSQVMFSLCLYAYGPSYLFIPLFLTGMIIWITSQKAIPNFYFISGIIVFVVLSVPIGLWIFINLTNGSTINWGSITIPALPVSPRFKSISVLSQPNIWSAMLKNGISVLTLLITQDDHLIFNTYNFGYLYRWTSVLIIPGCMAIIRSAKFNFSFNHVVLFLWIISGLMMGLLFNPNINRINILIIPMVILMALGIDSLHRWEKWVSSVVVVLIISGTTVFASQYFSQKKGPLAYLFNDGLLDAFKYANQFPDKRICVTDKVNMPYLYALVANKTDPEKFYKSVVYLDPNEPLRKVKSFDRFQFGLGQCASKAEIIIARPSEKMPIDSSIKSQKVFGFFIVHVK